MTIVVLLVLAAVWAAVLLPPALRARAEGTPADSIGSFRHQLSVLRRTGTGGPLAPAHQLTPYLPDGVVQAHRVPVRPITRSSATIKRRRDVFCGLLAALAGSFLLGLLPPLRVMWGLSAVLAVLLAGYVSLLVQLRNAAAEREAKVRYLPQSASPARAEPVLALARRSAN